MALKLDCNICAASLEADDLAIRRGIITCQYCNTILRITDKGTEVYAEEIKHRPLPDSVSVERDKDGQITVKVSNYFGLTQRQQLITKSLSILLIVLFFVALLQYTQPMPAYSRIPLLLFIAGGGIYFIIGLRNKAPEFVINNDVIIPSLGSPKISRKEVKQIYAVENRLHSSERGTATNVSLCLLTKDGKRTILVNNIPDVSTALQLEELVEVELEIFNLPVYGDSDLPRKKDWLEIKSASDKEMLDSFLCEYCGNHLTVTPQIRTRGFATCEYCTGLTLLHESDNQEPILGLPQDNLNARQFRVENKPNGLAIYPSMRSTLKPVLILGHGKLHSTRFDGTLFTLDISDINKFFVREMVRDQDEKEPFKWDDLGAKWHRFKNNWRRTYMEAYAYSGDVDEESKQQSPLEFKQYQLMAHMNDSRDYWLISNIDDPREALFLSQALKADLSS
jgi:hypothetical protein